MSLSRREAMRQGLRGGSAAGRRPRLLPGVGRDAEGEAQGQVGHPDLDVGRPAAPGHFRPQARSGQRLLRPAELADPHQRGWDPHRRAACRMLAKQADKYSIIRSMTHGDNGHETAAYLTQTGRTPRRSAGLSVRPRLPGRFQATLTLYDAQGREVAFGDG